MTCDRQKPIAKAHPVLFTGELETPYINDSSNIHRFSLEDKNSVHFVVTLY